MAKIVINKNFQSKYLYRAYERLVKPDYVSYTDRVESFYGPNGWTTKYRVVPYYSDLSSTFGTTWSGLTPTATISDYGDSDRQQTHKNRCNYFLCDETFLSLLNKINTKIKTDGISSFQKTYVNIVTSYGITDNMKTAPINLILLLSSLFNMDKTVRDNTINYFELSNIISTSDANYIKSILSPLKRVNSNVSMDGYGTDYVVSSNQLLSAFNNGKIDFATNEVIKLEVPYKASNNPLNKNLYLLVVPVSDNKLSTKYVDNSLLYSYERLDKTVQDGSGADIRVAEDGTLMLPYTSFHDKATNTVVNQIPYIALSLTEVGQGGDIEFDHLDEIEYLDEIKISIALPKEYV